MRLHTTTSILAGCLLAGPALAQDSSKLEPAPEPPAMPEPVQSGETLEPEVTIIQRKDSLVQEYRVNGRLYQIKVTPKKGKPYFLVDGDGDGVLETRMHELGADFLVPQWVLFSW